MPDQKAAKHCPDCFAEDQAGSICKICGFDSREYQETATELALFSPLHNGRYVVGRRLGAGGFGIVYAGWDTQLHSAVAIKEYFPGGVGWADRSRDGSSVTMRQSAEATEQYPRMRKRFLAEARLLRRVHELPTVVTAFDIFQENNTAYLVMERLRGATLDKHLKAQPGGKLNGDDWQQLYTALREAVAALHAHKIIHRDLKPDNIVLTQQGVSAIKLLDFGLARSGLGPRTTSMYAGTAGYMAPEQGILGGEVSDATDWYGFGATLYCAATGKAPADIPEPLHGLAPELPADLCFAIDQCLQKVPAQRPQSAAQLPLATRLLGPMPAPTPSAPLSAPQSQPQVLTSQPQAQPFSQPQQVTAPMLPARGWVAAFVTPFIILLLVFGLPFAAWYFDRPPGTRQWLSELVAGPEVPPPKMLASTASPAPTSVPLAATQRPEALLATAVPAASATPGGAALARFLGGDFAGSSGGLDADLLPEMVVVPTGLFRMGDRNDQGDADEKPVHRVRVDAFRMSKTEVTFAQYDAYAEANGKPKPDDAGWGRGNRPVINVSWDDAQGYIAWLKEKTGRKFRLPSEAEWEYAARAEEWTVYHWGNEVGENRANCKGCGSQWDAKKTAPVGQFKGNRFDLQDMHGNVWEWVEDCWHTSYEGAPDNGQPAWTSDNDGDCNVHVLRGGAWNFGIKHLRAAARNGGGGSGRAKDVGFRVAESF